MYTDDIKTFSIIHNDAFEVMEELVKKHPLGCFDMIFVDPPYFLSNGGGTCKNGQMVSVDKGDWDKSRGFESDLAFTEKWLRYCYTLLKQNGTIWVCGTQHNIFMLGFLLQKIGYHILNNITWEKPNPPPNLSCRYFTHSTETLLWAKKNKKEKHVFNYSEMREANGGKQMKSVWRIKPPAKKEKEFGKHPAQKPIELISRCIQASTTEDSIVFDPFMGSGTAAVASLGLNRKFMGIEINPDYYQIAKNRVEIL